MHSSSGSAFLLRSLSSTPTVSRRYYGSTHLPCDDLSPHLPNRIAEANAQNGLFRILQDVDNLPRRGFQIKMRAVSEQMYVGGSSNDFAEAFAKLALQETHDLADALEREAFAPELADDGRFHDVLQGVKAAMSLALGLDHAALIPPLELARRDAG
jgi:hypothetical protein